MTVYMDDAGLPATAHNPDNGRTHTSRWCHLFTDQADQAELHALARRIGLRRSWFQNTSPHPWRWHYDVTEGKRRHAVAAGAIEITWREAGHIHIARARAARGGSVGTTPDAHQPG